MQSYVDPLKRVRLTQCHQCYSWDGHLRPQCDKLGQEQLCFKCGETGHKPSQCVKEPCCLNCEGDHPVTARCCTIYKAELEIVLRDLKNQTITEYQDSRVSQTHQEIEQDASAPPQVTDSTRDLLDAAALACGGPDDFAHSLYSLIKASTPIKKDPPAVSLAYDCLLDESIDSNGIEESTQPKEAPPPNDTHQIAPTGLDELSQPKEAPPPKDTHQIAPINSP